MRQIHFLGVLRGAMSNKRTLQEAWLWLSSVCRAPDECLGGAMRDDFRADHTRAFHDRGAKDGPLDACGAVRFTP
jgi:hypothetical protein